MICPKCKEEGKRSTITPRGVFRTAMCAQSYYDEDGKYHIHDRNTSSESFSCSNGHRIEIKSKGRCPSCDFNAGQDSMDVT